MKLKQLLSVVLMLCMIASSCVAFAAPDYDAKYTTSDVSFGYVDGKVWTDATSLTGGSTVSAKVSASTSGDKENMVFSLFVYKNGKMYDCEVVTKEVGADAVEFVASADVPKDAEGCQVVAVLWNNFYDMKMVCDSALFPGANTKLRGLYIDGELVKDFSPDTTDYVYAIEPDAEKYPEITWETVDSAVKATYVAPRSFPGIAIVSVEGGNGEKTEYRIKYEATVGDFISNVGGLATNPVYVKGGLKVGAKAYNDRSYFVTAINAPEYEDADMIQASIAWQSDAFFKGSETVDWLTFDTTRGVTVKVLKSDNGSKQHFVEEGWTLEQTTMEGGFVQTTTVAVKNHNIAMSKHFGPGKVVIPNGKSETTYLVAIILDPIGYVPEGDEDEPEVPADETLDLASLTVNGVEVDNFDAQTVAYNYALSADETASKESPTVEYTLADSSSSAEANTTGFPGKTVITITNKEGKTKDYVINYTANMISGIALSSRVPEGASVAAFETDFQVGDRVFADRSTFIVSEINDKTAIGKDRIQLCAGWRNDEKPYRDLYISSTLVNDWVSFTVARDTVVTIYEDDHNDEFYPGYEKETATDSAYIVAPYGKSPLEYDVKYSKVFKAGAKVEIPNANKSKRIGMIVLTYAPWGTEYEEGETPDTPEIPDEPVVPDEPVEVDLVTSISLDGEKIADFNKDTLEYTVTLTDDQLAAASYPEVTYEIAEGAVAVVTNPANFPGFAEIKVTKGTEEKIYKINYKVPELQVNLTELSPADTPKATVLDAMTIGTPVFGDRSTFPVEAINDPDIEGTLWLRSASGWKNDVEEYRNLYMGNEINDWVNFEAKRGMVVTVYEDSTSNTSRFAYWTSEASEETPYIKATHATPLNYIAKHQRYFAAGETVEIPNLVSSRLYTATIKYLGWNEEAPELDVNVPVVRKISDFDLVTKVTKGEGINVTGGTWSGLSDITTTKYQLSKEFADITEPTEISITTDKIAKGYGIIVVSPLGETDDKNVIVNPDGSDIEWEDYTGVVVDYSYTNDGAEDFDPANATYVKRNGTAVTSTGSVAYVYETMNNSDDMYITGSALATTRNPFSGELHWTGLPEEYLGCNYIVVPFDGGFNGGEKSFTFTVDQPVKVWVHSSSSNMTVTDTIDDTQWTASQYVVRRRYQNVLDHLSCAYMLRKGYINESNIIFDGKVGETNGVRFNRYDVYENLKADCGTYLGWAIDPEKVEATGFTETINDYRYEEYLEAWVD